MLICSECLSENHENDEYCQICGSKLKKEYTILKNNFKGINILAVFIGTIIWIVLFIEIAAPHLINTNTDLVITASTLIIVQLISSAVAGYIENNTNKNAAINGGLLAFIPTLITAFYRDLNITIILFLIFLITGIIGGIIGGLLENKLK
jgi:membrane-associated HD superfamily phosphohydrolase